jgi:NAD(P)-dependent dehydrogenase (short-subunit alcohol dehydrogenase family)
MLDAARVVITGAATGIGRATAEATVAHGARVALVDVNESALESVVARLGPEAARAWLADVSVPSDVERAFDESVEWLGGLDAVFHAAGIMRGQGASLVDFPIDEWERVIAVNLSGSFLVAREAAKWMIPEGSGTIVLVASGAGVIGPSGSIAYGASKGGVHGLSMTIASTLASHGIRVIDVCPGLVDTPLFRRSLEEGASNRGVSYIPESVETLGAIRPESVAELMVLLLSDAARELKGSIFTN